MLITITFKLPPEVVKRLCEAHKEGEPISTIVRAELYKIVNETLKIDSGPPAHDSRS